MIMLAERASVKFLIYIRIRMHFLRRFNQIIVAQQLHRLRCGTGPIMRKSQPQMTRIARLSFSTSLIHDMPGRNSPSRSYGSDTSAFNYLLTYEILFSV